MRSSKETKENKIKQMVEEQQRLATEKFELAELERKQKEEKEKGEK